MARRIELDEVTIAYDERGADSKHAGSAVVFVHGLGGSSYAWWSQLAACGERGHRAIAYDQRGAGHSSRPPAPYSVETWARDLERLIDALGVERASLVGHSVGCMIAEHAALRLGDRAGALILIGGALRWRPEAGQVFEERIRLARAGRMDEIAEAVAKTGLSERCREQGPALHGLFCELIASNDPRGYADWSAATAAGQMIEPERIACPTLALCGELDPVTPPAFAEAIAAAIPSARTDSVEGAAHWCQLEAPEAVNAILLRFLDEVAT
jgi:pimeloyl-ACP methyl ester carboxylesterase